MASDLLIENVLISSWWKDRSGTAIRVQLIPFSGRNCLDVRTWCSNAKGILLPTAGGITCDIKHAEQFLRAFLAAHRRALALGLIKEAGFDFLIERKGSDRVAVVPGEQEPTGRFNDYSNDNKPA
jgi:hypothetical protein